MSCLGADEILELALGLAPRARIAEHDGHLAVCADCRSLVVGVAGDAATAGLAGARATEASEAKLDRYALADCLGRGATSIVFRAHDTKLRREVALKFLRDAPDEMAERLTREAEALAKLSHPNVVSVLDLGQTGDELFVAMELVRGETLRAFAARRRDDPRRVLAALLEAGAGLAAAHRVGLVHRDFKPDNVMVGEDGRARVLDFGLARATTPLASTLEPTATAGLDAACSSTLATSLTRTGALVGTPAYMAPELFDGHGADERSDQYAFGVVAWEMLVGARPVSASSFPELAARVRAGARDPTPPAKIGAPLRRALERALAVSPDHRFPSMDALLATLRAAARRERRRRVLFAFVLGVTAMAAMIGIARHAAVAACVRATTAPPTLAAAADELGRTMASYAEGLVEARRRTCEARYAWSTAPRAASRRATPCLEALEVRWAALVEALGEASAVPEARRRAAMAALPSPASCVEPTASRAAAHDERSPADPLARALARAETWRALGALERGLAEATELEAKARATGDAEIETAAATLAGSLLAELGSMPAAEDAWRRATTRANEAHLVGAAARAQVTALEAMIRRRDHLAVAASLMSPIGALVALARSPELDARFAEARAALLTLTEEPTTPRAPAR